MPTTTIIPPKPEVVKLPTEQTANLLVTLCHALYEVPDIDKGHLNIRAKMGDPKAVFTYRGKLQEQLKALLAELDKETTEALDFVWKSGDEEES